MTGDERASGWHAGRGRLSELFHSSKRGTPFKSAWKAVDVLLIMGVAVTLLYSGVAVLQAAGGIAWRAGVPLQQAAALTSILGALLEVTVILAPVYLLGIRRRHLTWASIGLHPTSRTWFRISLALGCAGLFLSGYVAVAVNAAVGAKAVNPQAAFFQPTHDSWLTATVIMGLSGVAIPAAEEILFRGVLYNWMRGRLPALPAMAASSLVFGFVHGDWVAGAAAFTIGVVSAIAYEKSRSLYPSIFIHAFSNTMKLAVMYGLLGTILH